MGEDAQIDDPDEGYGLSPALDETEAFTEVEGCVEPTGLVYSVDGSYAPQSRCYGKEKFREITVDGAGSVRAASRESVVFRSGVFCDESRSILANVSRTSQFLVKQNGSTIRIPQPLDVPLKLEKSQVNRSKSSIRPPSAKRREISPIRVASPVESEVNPSRNAQVYDPLRKISSEARDSNSTLNSNLVRKETNLMNAVRNMISGNQRGPLSKASSSTAVFAAITRSGSSSTVSTGRDGLTNQVQYLQEAVAKMDFGNRAVAGCNRRTGFDDAENTQDSFAMTEPLIIQKAPSLSSGSSASTIEQARHSSPHALADAAIRDADQCSKALRSGALDFMMSRNVGTNTRRGETVCVKHHIITHRVEIPDHYRHYRRHSASLVPAMHKPEFRPFKLDNQPFFLDIDAIPQLNDIADVRNFALDGADARNANHDSRDHVAQRQRRAGGGKRGRPIVIGRAVHVRGRRYNRPASAHVIRSTAAQVLFCIAYYKASMIPFSWLFKEQEQKQDQTIPTTNEEAPKATEEHAVQTEAEPSMVDVGVIAKDEVEEETSMEARRYSCPDPPKHVRFRKNSGTGKPPFVGSGQKSDSTYSVVANKQKVMNVVRTSFSDWHSLVTEIIYDSNCSDYARALQKALARERNSHFYQLRSLKEELEDCRSESQRSEVRADIARFKQRWTGRHEGVLTRLNNQIARGGVWSQVQQLRTIYSALTAS
ncbi:hypothetical protein OESDEN_13481 [Oesophagostomum dentatum]|uniref:Uncharacterized protein n=1 Tax=Oesophagostomum dentatum TaxID=61180 RepID=A0A0B1SP84_OESDE|nr:hypothetical protein OESDEN_13481 [Oesophagostomum dentatum]